VATVATRGNTQSHQELTADSFSSGAVLNKDDTWLHLIDEPAGACFERDFETGVLSEQHSHQEWCIGIGRNNVGIMFETKRYFPINGPADRARSEFIPPIILPRSAQPNSGDSGLYYECRSSAWLEAKRS
jgi:hypothetical protein